MSGYDDDYGAPSTPSAPSTHVPNLTRPPMLAGRTGSFSSRRGQVIQPTTLKANPRSNLSYVPPPPPNAGSTPRSGTSLAIPPPSTPAAPPPVTPISIPTSSSVPNIPPPAAPAPSSMDDEYGERSAPITPKKPPAYSPYNASPSSSTTSSSSLTGSARAPIKTQRSLALGGRGTALPPPPPPAAAAAAVGSASSVDEYGVAASPSVSTRLPPSVRKPPPPSSAAQQQQQQQIPPPSQAGGDLDDYGSPRVMSAVPPPPMTASGRMPPTGRYFSPASKQQVKEGVSTPRMSSLGTETTTTSTNVPLDNSTTNVTATVNNNTNEEDVDDMDDYGTPTTHTSVNSPPSSSAPKQQHQQHSLVAQDNDGYGAPPSPAVTSAHHPPGRLGPSPLGMSARGSSGGGGNNNNNSQGSSPSPLDGTVPVQRRAAPTFKAPSMHKQPGPSPLQSSSGAVPTTTTTAAAAADNNNNNNNGKGSKVEDYTAAAVVRTRKERVKPKALIAPPGHLSERPERALYSLNAVDRSTWRARVVAENPHIGELRERVYPLARGIAFCKLFHPGQRQAKEELKQTQVVQLILQHLQLKGFNATRRVLEKEAHVATPRHKLHTSRLAAFVHAAIRDTDAVYDYVIGEKVDFGKQAEERVWQMGLQEEEEESEDCDIWQEPADRVRFEPEGELKGNVKCGSFNKLVELLTDEYVISHNDYLQTFLLTYQSFATPEKLLQKIVQRFNVPATAFQGQQAQQAQAQTLIIRGRVCNFLRKWIEEYPTDFDEKLNVQVKQFIDIVAATPATTRLIAPVSNSFQKMLAESRAARRSARTAAAEPPEPIVPQNFFSRRWDQWHPLELDEEEIARQLSLLDWESFRKIKPTELLNQAWSKPKLKHRAPNVLAFIAQFNRTSAWAATEILSAPNIRERIRVVTKLIKISEKLTAMNNFNSVMSISAALNCSSVSRLKHTFAELSPYALKGKKDLEELVSSDGNFKVLRQRIAAIDPNTTPCIPYLGFILSDLTFTDENPDKINGMINFGKRVLVYKIIHGLLSRQTTPYNFQPVQQIVRILKKAPLKKDDELYELSLKHEPRGAPRSQIK